MANKTRDFAGFYAPEKIGKTRRVTPEGFLILEGTPIARTGEQLYNGHEINKGITEDDPTYIPPNGAGYIIVERSPEEVFRAETLASFEGKDFVIEHPPDGVDVENWKNHTVGHVQNVRRGEGIEDDLVVADIIVKDPVAIAYINKRLPEISSGYDAHYESIEPGRARQRNIIGNHVAGVLAGRAGARVAVRDNQTEVEELSMNSKIMRAVLTACGIKTEDAAKVEAAMEAVSTTDAGEFSKEIGEKIENLSKDMKAIKDWQASRDMEREEERKERDAKAARDAEAEKGKKKEEEETEETEKTGDTVLEAEAPGHVVNLGKTWKGGLTGDSATVEPVLQAVVARAEILAPGIAKPTADSIRGNKGTVLAGFMRTALKQHATTDSGKANLSAFMVDSATVDTLKGQHLIGIFNGVSQLARAKNNMNASSIQRRTGDFGPAPKSNADFNKATREFWEKRKA